MTGKQAFLCNLLNCGEYDLHLIERADADWGDVLDDAGNIRNFNSVMLSLVAHGLTELDEAVRERRSELINGEWDATAAAEHRYLGMLEPCDDIESFHNYIDTHVYFVKHEEIYRKYMAAALERFAETTGFEIEGGWPQNGD